MISADLNDQQLRAIYAWIDAIPLSRPKRNIGRDFSDGVMLAEVIAAYFPNMVEVHNYPAANSLKQKVYNFETLNQRVLKKLGFFIPRETIEDIANCKPGVIEGVLNTLQLKMAKYREKIKSQNDSVTSSPAIVHESKHIPQPPDNQMNNQPKPEQSKPKAVRSQSQMRGKNINIGASLDEEILLEKEQQIRDLQETVEILELKIAKLEQLVRLKDNKIQKLLNKSA